MIQPDTIVALSSGAPPSGVAVIRISGPMTREILDAWAGGSPPPRRMAYVPIGKPVIDNGLVVFFPAPNSFTGEDCAELQVHGSAAVVRALLRALTELHGIRLAEAGEFTRRAFENGRLDLTEVEGLGDLIAAETESQRRQALARLAGGVSDRLEDWRMRLLDLRAEIEARLDFSDESDVGALPENFASSVDKLQAEFSEAIESVARGRIVREGVRVALAGPPNAGKSSLLNALSRSNVAIVTDEPGTTRDVREVQVDLGGQLVVLLDMAGLRDTDSKAEAEGVRRAREEIATADLTLWLVAPDIPASAPTPDGAWIVGTKADMGRAAEFCISSVTGAGIAELLDRLTEFASVANRHGEPALLSRERDRVALEGARAALADTLTHLGQSELAAEDLRKASAALGRLLGRMDAEAVLDRLFSAFCIGK